MTLVDWFLWAAIAALWSRDVGVPVQLAKALCGALLLVALILGLLGVLRR